MWLNPRAGIQLYGWRWRDMLARLVAEGSLQLIDRLFVCQPYCVCVTTSHVTLSWNTESCHEADINTHCLGFACFYVFGRYFSAGTRCDFRPRLGILLPKII